MLPLLDVKMCLVLGKEIESGMKIFDLNAVHNTSKREQPDFDYCQSCGRLMRTIKNQAFLITACADWEASTVEDIRRILKSVGVHDLYEVNPGYCEYCSTDNTEKIFK